MPGAIWLASASRGDDPRHGPAGITDQELPRRDTDQPDRRLPKRANTTPAITGFSAGGITEIALAPPFERPEAGGARGPQNWLGMKLRELCRRLTLDIRTAASKLDTEVTGGYASDLLSHAIAQAQEGNILITLQGHPNVVAVASLLDLAGVIITEGMIPDATTLEKAEERGIPIMTTPLTTYTVVGSLYDMGVPGVDQDSPSLRRSWPE